MCNSTTTELYDHHPVQFSLKGLTDEFMYCKLRADNGNLSDLFQAIEFNRNLLICLGAVVTAET
jgi:hypothetical protein